MKGKIHILCLFDYQCTTGFATVSHNLVRELKKKFGERLFLDIIAINYFAEAFQPDPHTMVFPAALLNAGTPNQDAYGRKEFLKLLQETDYDGIFIIQDYGVILPMGKFIKEIKIKKREAKRKNFKSVYYFPVDHPPVPEHFEYFDVFDKLVTYTEYGRNEVLKLCPELRGRLEVVPHGINSRNFYPLPESRKKLFRKDYFGNNADKTIISNINRNQFRKDIPTTIWSFIEYKQNYNRDAFLYLHMTPKEEMGWDLKRLLGQTELKEGVDYLLPAEHLYNAAADIETVNSIYNASDIFFTTTTGEGWGLTITEAMACQCPVVAPGHTSIIEIGNNGKRLYQMENFYPFVSRYDNNVRLQCDYLEAAELINAAVVNKEETAKKVDLAYKYTQTISWQEICRRWSEIFSRVF